MLFDKLRQLRIGLHNPPAVRNAVGDADKAAGIQLAIVPEGLLAQNLGIVVPRDIILDRIWGLESDVSSNNIDSYMKILRKKLDTGDGRTIIKTVRGVGYKLEADT